MDFPLEAFLLRIMKPSKICLMDIRSPCAHASSMVGKLQALGSFAPWVRGWDRPGIDGSKLESAIEGAAPVDARPFISDR